MKNTRSLPAHRSRSAPPLAQRVVVAAQAHADVGVDVLQEEAAVAQAGQLVGQADVFQRLVGLFQFEVLFEQLRLGRAQRLQRGGHLAVGAGVVERDRAVGAQGAEDQPFALAVGARRAATAPSSRPARARRSAAARTAGCASAACRGSGSACAVVVDARPGSRAARARSAPNWRVASDSRSGSPAASCRLRCRRRSAARGRPGRSGTPRNGWRRAARARGGRARGTPPRRRGGW